MYEKLGKVEAGSRWSNVSNRMINMTRMKIRCHCSSEMICHNFTNTCDCCGRDYNMSGALLADRSQWGEETGESVSDILMSNDY